MLYAIFVLVIVGLILYLIQTCLPLPAPIKLVIQALVVLFLCLWLASLIGYAPFPGSFAPGPRLR